MANNLILRTDSYKLSHPFQLPLGTTRMSAYIEARNGGHFDEVTFFGLQMFLLKYLSRRVVYSDVVEAKKLAKGHGEPFAEDAWMAIVKEHDGILPLKIEAIPEGLTVPTGTPLVQVSNTDPRFPWLTTFIETQLLRAVWYPSTVATLSRHAKQIIYDGLVHTSDDPDGQIGFKLHDFGARGCTSSEQAEIGGLAHLVNFLGTDTVEALVAARKYYDEPMAGFSIPAAEHSTITAWGQENEAAAYRNMLQQFGGDKKLVAVVSDSYDLFNAVENIWGVELHDEVLATGGTLVVRPDSGNPVDTPIAVIERLAEKFGFTTNSKGYKVLHPSVRVIQGDGMSLLNIKRLVWSMTLKGWSIDNIAFGMGGGLLQDVNRDSIRFAMKANQIEVDGVERDICKKPKTDPGKASKAGRQQVWRTQDGRFFSTREGCNDRVQKGDEQILNLVWQNGNLYEERTLAEIRKNAQLRRA